jgi:hypothetical protein
MAIRTATGDFNYTDIFYGESLNDLINLVHKELSHQLHWKSIPLKVGTFGYDSLACSIGWILNNPTNDIEKGSEIIHKAWIRNYLFWSIIKPYELLPKYYLHSSKPLVDKRRKMLAVTAYEKLPEIEKETNRIIYKTLFDYLRIEYVKVPVIDDTFLDL